MTGFYTMLDVVIAHVGRSVRLGDLNKTMLYDGVANKLNKVNDTEWGSSYIWQVYSGKIMPSRFLCSAVSALFVDIQNEKAKPDRPDYRLRPVQIRCTGAQYDRILKLSTTQRTTALLAGLLKMG